jgi:regulator of protease activity HflC (stomatin/prohibitin superfamily)
MNEQTLDLTVIGTAFILPWLAWALLGWISYRTGVALRPFESVLILRFGKCIEEIQTPGFHLRPHLWIPGYSKLRVSKQMMFERIQDLHINDLDGTTLRIDLWIECKVIDAKRSVFAVESWMDALKNLIIHSVVSKAGSVRLETILSDRKKFIQDILDEVSAEAKTWGISVEQLWIQDVRLLPEISKQFFDRVAAQLELKKARVEEIGKIKVQILKAETEKTVAQYQATARSMLPQAVGRAYQKLNRTPGVMTAYEKLYQLSLLQPQKLVSFVGFKDSEVRALDALMIPAEGESAPRKSNPGHGH